MAYVNSRIIYATLFYILLLVLIIISKPALMFERDGELKPFGIDDGDGKKTIFSFGVFTVVLAILCYYLFCIIDLVFRNTAQSF